MACKTKAVFLALLTASTVLNGTAETELSPNAPGDLLTYEGAGDSDWVADVDDTFAEATFRALAGQVKAFAKDGDTPSFIPSIPQSLIDEVITLDADDEFEFEFEGEGLSKSFFDDDSPTPNSFHDPLEDLNNDSVEIAHQADPSGALPERVDILEPLELTPRNAALMASLWPVAHHDSFGQGYSEHSGMTYRNGSFAVPRRRLGKPSARPPSNAGSNAKGKASQGRTFERGNAAVDFLFDPAVKGTLSLFFCNENSTVAWGSGVRAVYKLDTHTHSHASTQAHTQTRTQTPARLHNPQGAEANELGNVSSGASRGVSEGGGQQGPLGAAIGGARAAFGMALSKFWPGTSQNGGAGTYAGASLNRGRALSESGSPPSRNPSTSRVLSSSQSSSPEFAHLLAREPARGPPLDIMSVSATSGGPGGMRLIDAVQKPKELVADDQYRGIYSLVAADGTFYTSAGNQILALHHADPADPYSAIVTLGSFVLDDIDPKHDGIVSLNMLFCGDLAYLTSSARVGIVSRDLRIHKAKIKLPGTVTNAMTVDQYNGLYLVTTSALHRLQYLPALDSRASSQALLPASQALLSVSWSKEYARGIKGSRWRLSSVGSGTTPTVFTDPATRRLCVAICDGSYRQSLIVFDALSGNKLASRVVDFGTQNSRALETFSYQGSTFSHQGSKPSKAKSEAEESFTEQSLLIYNGEILVTQNALTESGKRMGKLIMENWGAKELLVGNLAPERLTKRVSLAPVALGDAPVGIQKFALTYNGGNRTHALVSKWVRKDWGCPNSISTMSVESSVVYCVSRAQYGSGASDNYRETPPSRTNANLNTNTEPDELRDSLESRNSLESRPFRVLGPPGLYYPAGSFEGFWTIAAFDWKTGRKVFDVKTGSDIRFNSLYAAAQVGAHGDILHGSIGGIVRLSLAPKNSARENDAPAGVLGSAGRAAVQSLFPNILSS